MTIAKYTIGHLARETGCKIPTIRYYEKIGLLPEPERSARNTRLYGNAHVQRLGFIQHCRELGLSQNEIRELLMLEGQPDLSCEAVNEIAKNHLEDVNRRISRLMSLKAELEHMVSTCSGGIVGNCRIIEILADHSHSHCLRGEH